MRRGLDEDGPIPRDRAVAVASDGIYLTSIILCISVRPPASKRAR